MVIRVATRLRLFPPIRETVIIGTVLNGFMKTLHLAPLVLIGLFLIPLRFNGASLKRWGIGLQSLMVAKI